MNYVFLLFIMLLLIGCGSKQASSEQLSLPADKKKPATQMSYTARDSQVDSSYADYWCSSRIFQDTKSKLDKLDLVIIADFLAAFHESCLPDISQQLKFDRLLLEVVIRKPETVLGLLTKNSSLSRSYIIDRLHGIDKGKADLSSAISRIQDMEINEPSESIDWKTKLLTALEKD